MVIRDGIMSTDLVCFIFNKLERGTNMKTKKILIAVMTIILAMALVLAGCAKTDNGQSQTTTTAAAGGGWEDGIYFAQVDEYPKSGWKAAVTLEVKDGKIVMVDWNAAHRNGGIDKKTSSETGVYAMVAKGNAQSEWHEQAEKTETYLMETQDPTDINYTDDAGSTDSIAGVSIHVSEFFMLAQEALDAGPVGYGLYKDGAYHAEDSEFSENGWKEIVDVTVISGYIASVSWNPINKDDAFKRALSEDGTYGMVAKGNAQSEWHEQAALFEQDLLANQDIREYTASDDEGRVDTIAGVSIHVMQIIELLEGVMEYR